MNARIANIQTIVKWCGQIL